MNDEFERAQFKEDSSDVHRLVGRILDGITESDDAIEPEWAGLDRVDRELIADVQFLDALLSHAYRADDRQREARLARVMDALNAEAPNESPAKKIDVSPPALLAPRPGRAPARRWFGVALAVCVAAVLCSTLWPLARSPHSVDAAVARVLQEARHAPDRQYNVTFLISLSLATHREQQAMLYVRGSDRFALRKSSPLTGGDAWVGGNERESWVVPGLGPVLMSRDVRLLDSVLGEESVSTPILNISTILKRMAERYELELLDDESIPMFAGTEKLAECERIRGRLKDEAAQLPKVIDVWATRSSGTAVRLVLDWQLPDGEMGLDRLTLELAGQPDLPNDWYEHSAHHDADRNILEIPGD